LEYRQGGFRLLVDIMPELRYSDLSAARQAFTRQCQRIWFGRIERLRVCCSEPAFDEQTGVLIDLKLDRDDDLRPEQHGDYTLSAELVRFFAKLEGIGSGIVEQIEIRSGLPRRMLFKPSDSQRK
jgi:hypothetical protein